MRRNVPVYLMLLVVLGFTSCSSDDDTNVETPQGILTLTLEGLGDLGDDYVYEGWILVDDIPVSTGTFTVSGSGELSKDEFEVNYIALEAASAFVLSVEPASDSDPSPAATKILVGEFEGEKASVDTHIFGDFGEITGDFFLRTPTDEETGNNGNDEYGIWFGVPGNNPPEPSLVLPELPEGWIYEGWVVGEEGPVSTGTFSEFDTADNSNLYSGDFAGPQIPGEDFFNNAPEGFTFPYDVRNKNVVISIEPVPDNSDDPFFLKPLLGASGENTAPVTYDLNNNVTNFPKGFVIREF